MVLLIFHGYGIRKNVTIRLPLGKEGSVMDVSFAYRKKCLVADNKTKIIK